MLSAPDVALLARLGAAAEQHHDRRATDRVIDAVVCTSVDPEFADTARNAPAVAKVAVLNATQARHDRGSGALIAEPSQPAFKDPRVPDIHVTSVAYTRHRFKPVDPGYEHPAVRQSRALRMAGAIVAMELLIAGSSRMLREASAKSASGKGNGNRGSRGCSGGALSRLVDCPSPVVAAGAPYLLRHGIGLPIGLG